MDISDDLNEDTNKRKTTGWWHNGDGFTYSTTPSLENEFIDNAMNSWSVENELSNSTLSWSEGRLNNSTPLVVATWLLTSGTHTNETELLSSTISWSEGNSDNSSIWSEDCTPAAIPIEIQFSGLGDYDPGSYMRAVLFIVSIIGILGNGIVLLVLCKNRFAAASDTSSTARDSGSVIETLLVNQSVADLLTAILLLFASNYHIPEHYSAMTWDAELVCRVFRTQMPLSICFSSSVYNLVGIALEQYVQIIHPLFYHARVRRLPARAYVAAIWVVGICSNVAFTIPVSGIVVVLDDSDDDDEVSNDVSDVTPIPLFVCSEYDFNLDRATLKAVSVATAVVRYFLPASIIVYTFCHIVIKLQRRRYQVGPLGQMSVFRSVKVAVLKSMALFCCVFIVCWSLNSFVNTLSYFGVFTADFFVSPLYAFIIVIFYGCCAINPLLYAVRYRKFKDTLKNLFPFIKRVAGKHPPHTNHIDSIIELH